MINEVTPSGKSTAQPLPWNIMLTSGALEGGAYFYAEDGSEKTRAPCDFLSLSCTGLESNLDRLVEGMRTRTQKENCHWQLQHYPDFFLF
jgi:hypothetical protein